MPASLPRRESSNPTRWTEEQWERCKQYAAIQAIDWHIRIQIAELHRIERTLKRLGELQQFRLEQLRRGEWPTTKQEATDAR